MYTESENNTVGQLSELLALECGYSPKTAIHIRIAAVFHDVGKKYIPDKILMKPGKLTPQEFEIMKNHTKIGFEMLSCLKGELGEKARIIALYHHQHWQGQGYWGVPASTLPRYVGIVSICDVFTALLSCRAYKGSWPPEKALAHIKELAGTQFCPEIASTFINVVRTDTRVAKLFTQDN